MPMLTDRRRPLVAFAALIGSVLPLAAAQQEPSPPAPVAPPAPASAPAAPPAPLATYRWLDDWARMPADRAIGSTHGALAVDRQGRIFANTDTEAAVLVFAGDGRLLTSWGKEYRGGLHGMSLVVEDDVEYLYLAHTGRHEVLKATLDGKVVWTIGWPESAGIYAGENEYHPTAVVRSRDGRLFVADGYGKSWIHVYDSQQRYLKSFGGPGTDAGKLQTPHGLWLDPRGERELLLVCDRENHRLQWFTLDGEFVRQTGDGLRRPCNVWPLAGGGLAVADLTGRVALLDRDDRPVQFLGDEAPAELRATNQVPREQWRTGTFFAPHSVCADAQGDLYVMDWNLTGRITKLVRTTGR